MTFGQLLQSVLGFTNKGSVDTLQVSLGLDSAASLMRGLHGYVLVLAGFASLEVACRSCSNDCDNDDDNVKTMGSYSSEGSMGMVLVIPALDSVAGYSEKEYPLALYSFVVRYS